MKQTDISELNFPQVPQNCLVCASEQEEHQPATVGLPSDTKPEWKNSNNIPAESMMDCVVPSGV